MGVSLVGVGDYFSKVCANNPTFPNYLYPILFYLLASIMWVMAIIQYNKMSVLGSIWGFACSALYLIVAFFIFHESLTNKQIIGLVLGIISAILLVF
jgi:multidrug transporter EmrE-like cation transporter